MNTHRMGIWLRNFGDILSVDLESDQVFIVGHLATFIASIISHRGRVKKERLTNVQRLRQIKVGWKGHVHTSKTLEERTVLLEDKKSTVFFKVSDVVNEPEGSCITKDSTLLSFDELETKLSNLKDKRAKEFDSLSDYPEITCTCRQSTMSTIIIIFLKLEMIC